MKHNPLILVLGILWKIWFLLYFVVTMILLYPVFFVLLSKRSWYPACFQVMRFWGCMLAAGCGIWVSVKNKHLLNNLKGPIIICANHASYLDIILTYCVINKYFVFMGKKELEKVPLFNIFFKRMNILVDRKNHIGAHKAFLRASADIDQGISLAIFPEGTISKDAPRLKPFKNGLFKLAIDKQVPILPITFLNNFKLMEDRAFLQSIYRPGIARIVVHEPVSTAGLNENDLIPLREQVKTIIQTSLQNEYRR